MRDQVSHPYKTKAKIIVLCILIFKFSDIKLEDKIFCTEWQQALPDFSLLLISSWIEFLSVKVYPKYFNCSEVFYYIFEYYDIEWLGKASFNKYRIENTGNSYGFGSELLPSNTHKGLAEHIDCEHKNWKVNKQKRTVFVELARKKKDEMWQRDMGKKIFSCSM
jgi:hypothetical protein